MNLSIRKISLLLCLFIGLQTLHAQTPQNWFLLDQQKDGYPGVSVDKAYQDLLKNRKSQTVIVAIIDSGVDYLHEDLKGNMWVNPGEVPNNGKDDDGNGYIDDIHGWNFIGGANGANVSSDTYEATRLYVKYKPVYENADPKKLTKKAKKEYDIWLKVKEEVESNRSETEGQLTMLNNAMGMMVGAFGQLEVYFEGKEFTKENVEKLEPGDNQNLSIGKAIAIQAFESGEEFESVAQMKNMAMEQIAEGLKYLQSSIKAGYNTEFDPRHIVGDNYADATERYYGNSNAKGPDALHGTHVAGIVGAVRNNAVGMDGIANNVKIMSVRAVPDGDERDKDVANAIRYAVDNGASVINMSFGKGFSWNKQIVDEAVRYAEKNDVLLVHAAGNSAQDNDKAANFPNKYYEKRGWFSPKMAKNWLEIGALSPNQGENAAAGFSNYGKKNVDIFAPGVQIYATTPENGYQNLQGTSMASPAVAGVAAVLRSYYPELTAVQVKDIIMSTATPIKTKVIKPGTKELVDFTELSVTGGYINTYEAVKKAQTVKGKKKSGKGGAAPSGATKQEKVVRP